MELMNPQRTKFKEAYCNPESPTFTLIRESALAAGFSETYARVLMSSSTKNAWAKEIINDYKLKSIAEKNLEILMVQDDDIKVKADITKFVKETLHKDKYSKRTELTGAGGGALIPVEPATQIQIESAIDGYFKKANAKKDPK